MLIYLKLRRIDIKINMVQINLVIRMKMMLKVTLVVSPQKEDFQI